MYAKFFKRAIDFIASLLALIVFSPLLVTLYVVGAIALKGDPFFYQARPGKKGKDGQEKIFCLIKFRTMSNARDADGNLLPDDVRLGRYGRFLRSTSLDELPELFNILKGDMSLVGPRPQLVRDMTFMSAEQRRRHDVRPGLTGLAQVSGRNAISWEKKFEYDMRYIDAGITFLGDAKIVFLTAWKVLKKSDVVREGTVSDMDFGDWLLQEGKVDRATYDEKQVKAQNLLGGKTKSKNIEKWIYYNYAMVPTTPPHEKVDTASLKDKLFWRQNKTAFLARWTSDFDCGYETEWWYVIKDTPSTIEDLPKRVRKEVRRGLENLEIKTLDPIDDAEQIQKVYRQAMDGYLCPEGEAELIISRADNEQWIGAFIKGSAEMIAWKHARFNGECVEMLMSKAIPERRNLYPFAALNWWQINEYLNSGQYRYMSNGTKNILHETNYHYYLIEKFGFRKAFCLLHIDYPPKIKWLIHLLYPCRFMLLKFNKVGKMRLLNAVLKMEEISRASAKLCSKEYTK